MLISPSPSAQPTTPEEILNAEANTERLEKPGVIERMMKGIHDRVNEILENNPITRVIRRVQSWKQKVSHLLGWTEGKNEGLAASMPESPPSTSTPIAPPEPENSATAESPFENADQEYRERLKQKEDLIAHDMATISAQISRETNGGQHSLERNEKFATFAQQRADEIKNTPIDAQGGIQHCSSETLAKNGCVAENILRVPFEKYPTAAKLMEAFMNSDEHRKNLKGNYQAFNVAVRFDEEHGMVCAVIVYAKGKPKEGTNSTPLPAGTPDSSSQIDLLEPYREALKEESGKYPDIFVDSFEDAGLVLVDKKTQRKEQYLFKENALPPQLVRLEGQDKKETTLIPITHVFEDFKTTEQSNKPVQETPARRPSPQAPTDALETEMASGLH